MTRPPKLTLGQVLDWIYSYEMNVGLQSFWDGGWTVWLGDELNGHYAEKDFLDEDFSKIPEWIRQSAEEQWTKWASEREINDRRAKLYVVKR